MEFSLETSNALHTLPVTPSNTPPPTDAKEDNYLLNTYLLQQLLEVKLNSNHKQGGVLDCSVVT